MDLRVSKKVVVLSVILAAINQQIYQSDFPILSSLAQTYTNKHSDMHVITVN